MILNKSNKIAFNYLISIALSALLFWGIWVQIKQQLSVTSFSFDSLRQHTQYLFFAFLLMPLNIFIESKRWQSISDNAQTISFKDAMQSVFCGIAFSVITPNRIGEYPGRIYFLKRKNVIRLIAVSVMAVLAQILVFVVLGSMGILRFHCLFSTVLIKGFSVLLIGVFIMLLLSFFFFEQWMNRLARFHIFKRLKTYTYLVQKISTKEQMKVLLLSFLRVLVFSTQLVLLLWWNEINVTFFDGLLMSFVFFLSIAVIPSFAFAELGIRGKMSLFLFAPFSSNAIGIVMAIFMLWCINLLLPALFGYFILLKNKLLLKK